MLPAAGAVPVGTLPSLPHGRPSAAEHGSRPAVSIASVLQAHPIQPASCASDSRFSASSVQPFPPCQVSAVATPSSLAHTSPDDKPELPDASSAVFGTVQDEIISNSGESDKFLLLPQKRRRDSPQSQQTGYNHVVSKPLKNGLVVIIKPTDSSKLITSFNPLAIKSALESVVPGGVLQVRPNYRLNLLAVDTRNAVFTERLLKISSIAKIQVHAYEPHPSNCGMGVIRGVATDLSLLEIIDALRQRTPIRSVRRLGKTSQSVLIAFATETAPEHVIIGYTRYRVFQYYETPIQCSKCQRFGHVAVACTFSLRCSRCAGNHDRSACIAEDLRCPNCTKQHESTSNNCSVRRKEKAIIKFKTANKTDYKSAKANVQHNRTRVSKEASQRNLKTEGYTSVDVDKDFPPLPLRECEQSDKFVAQGAATPHSTLEAAHTPAALDAPGNTLPVASAVTSPVAFLTSPAAPLTTAATPRQTRAGRLSKPARRRSIEEQSENTDQRSFGRIIFSLAETLRNFLVPFSSPVAKAIRTLIDYALPHLAQWR